MQHPQPGSYHQLTCSSSTTASKEATYYVGPCIESKMKSKIKMLIRWNIALTWLGGHQDPLSSFVEPINFYGHCIFISRSFNSTLPGHPPSRPSLESLAMGGAAFPKAMTLPPPAHPSTGSTATPSSMASQQQFANLAADQNVLLWRWGWIAATTL